MKLCTVLRVTFVDTLDLLEKRSNLTSSGANQETDNHSRLSNWLRCYLREAVDQSDVSTARFTVGIR
jgi:hypothetical protein